MKHLIIGFGLISSFLFFVPESEACCGFSPSLPRIGGNFSFSYNKSSSYRNTYQVVQPVKTVQTYKPTYTIHPKDYTERKKEDNKRKETSREYSVKAEGRREQDEKNEKAREQSNGQAERTRELSVKSQENDMEQQRRETYRERSLYASNNEKTREDRENTREITERGREDSFAPNERRNEDARRDRDLQERRRERDNDTAEMQERGNESASLERKRESIEEQGGGNQCAETIGYCTADRQLTCRKDSRGCRVCSCGDSSSQVERKREWMSTTEKKREQTSNAGAIERKREWMVKKESMRESSGVENNREKESTRELVSKKEQNLEQAELKRESYDHCPALPTCSAGAKLICTTVQGCRKCTCQVLVNNYQEKYNEQKKVDTEKNREVRHSSAEKNRESYSHRYQPQYGLGYKYAQTYNVYGKPVADAYLQKKSMNNASGYYHYNGKGYGHATSPWRSGGYGNSYYGGGYAKGSLYTGQMNK